MSLAELKRNRRSMIDTLIKEVEKVSSGNKNYGDDDMWKPTTDKTGNGYAVIRFLPAPDPHAAPWVQFWDHGFQGPTGRWYIERSLTSIGQPDPVSDLNSSLWNSGHESDKDKARKQKRRLHYVSNIYVVSDPERPENEGKVFKYQYGKKIFDKIIDVMKPQFEDEKPINPFNLWDGADFILKIRQVEGWRNYDKSEFATPKPLKEDDKELDKIYKQVFDLSEYSNPKNYKSYNVLLKKLNEVLGEVSILKTKEEAEPEKTPGPVEVNSVDLDGFDDEEESMDSFFEKLAKEQE